MHIIAGMAAKATGRCLPVLVARRMAIRAGRTEVRAQQREIAKIVIEDSAIDRDYVGSPALMIGMTNDALSLFCGAKQPMKPTLPVAICGNVFMTVHAQCGLRQVRLGIMASSAVTLDISVTLDHATRHDEFLKPRHLGVRREPHQQQCRHWQHLEQHR